MFGTSQSGANAYARVSIETGIDAASPHRLIDMLFEGALIALNNATQHMHTGNVPQKGMAISKAIMIIDNGLRASLDKKAGGDLALNLYALYEYMSKRLLIANYKNDPAIIIEVRGLLTELRGAWQAIDPQGTPVGNPSLAPVLPTAPPTRLAKA